MPDSDPPPPSPSNGDDDEIAQLAERTAALQAAAHAAAMEGIERREAAYQAAIKALIHLSSELSDLEDLYLDLVDRPDPAVPSQIRYALSAHKSAGLQCVTGLVIDGEPTDRMFVLRPQGTNDPARDRRVWRAVQEGVRRDRIQARGTTTGDRRGSQAG